MSHTPPKQARFAVESLEAREMPAAGGWLVEPFQRGPVNGLPADWRQWSNQAGATTFAVDQAGPGLGDQGRLVSDGTSATVARAWVTTPFAADVEASAAVQLSSLSPAQVFVRGQNPNGAAPSYYAASVVRGAEVQLLRVVNGQSALLGRIKSADWISNQWVTLKIRAEGNTLSVFLYRGDTNQYLGAAGKWVRQPTAAIVATDTAIRAGGVVGVARGTGASGPVALDSMRIGPPGDNAATPIREERFNEGASAGVPPAWSQWVGGGGLVQFATAADETLRIASTSAGQARVWMTQPVPTDSQVSASVFVDSLAPAGVFARGSGVNGSRPTYYSLTVTRGLTVELSRVLNGVSTSLGRIDTAGWQSGLWLQMSLVVKGKQLAVQIYRSDTGQYLNADGSWGLAPAYAMLRTDAAITSGGLAGLSRGTGAAGELTFDNFIVTTAPATLTSPKPIPTEQDKPVTVTVPPVTVPPPPVIPPSPPVSPPPPPPTSPPVSPPTSPPPVKTPTTPPGLPTIPQSQSWIRVAQLAYSGTPLSAYERSLLRSGVDLVIPNLSIVSDIAAISPDTPQLIYTNVSNIYQSLLTDWLAYADRMGYDREAAFYHVGQATAFQGLSASAIPVDQFWSLYRGSDATGWAYINRLPKASDPAFALAAAGESVVLGYPEKFRELNVNLQTNAGGNWHGLLQYVQAVDANGNPTRWGTVPLLSDTSNGFRRSGQLLFDPPRDWVMSSINGSARLYHVRILTTVGGTAPLARSLLTNDYTRFNATAFTGTTPAFDSSADKNGDGYLSDAEYAKRKPGMDARFAYQSRLTFPYYGPNRYATNPASPQFRAWAADYHLRAAAAQPKVDGFFVDNSTGLLDVNPASTRESQANYAVNYGTLLGEVNAALMKKGKWIVSNTVGGGTAIDAQSKSGVSYLEEFALRPQYANAVQFEDLAATIAYRRQLSGAKAYEILDSYPTAGVEPTSPRFQLSALAMYYLVADPTRSFLMLNGGNEPASSWTRHWTDAIKYNVGQPQGAFSVFTKGNDPANTNLQFTIYQRKYANALVLYKPVSYFRGTTGSIADNTATTHQLDGLYRKVNADGTLGPPTRTVTLRNGEGVVLAKA